MKAGKTQSVMYIFMNLLKHGSINKTDITEELEISDLTFRRYLQELRAFLVNFNFGYEIKYNKTDDVYFLVSIKN